MTRITLIITTYIILFSNHVSAQNIYVDLCLQQNVELFKLREPLKLWLDFLHSEDERSGAVYWNQQEVEQFSDSTYFQLQDLDYFEMGDKIQTLQYGLTVLSITQQDSLYKITSKFGFAYNDSMSVTPFIFHVYAKTESVTNKLKLYNPFPINQRLHMTETRVGNITYIYPNNYKFNTSLAKKQNKEIKQIAKDFGFMLEDYRYFFTTNRSNYYEMKGFDFHFENIGHERPFGKADTTNNIAYTYGGGEYFPHELIHLFLNPEYPEAHPWFIEGFCTYFGGSTGQDLNWHKERLKNYLLEHPDFDLNQAPELLNMDEFTGYKYVHGGYFIELAYEKGGAQKVKEVLSFGNSKAEFYSALEKVLGIQKEDLNAFVRENL